MALIDDSYFIGEISLPNISRWINTFNQLINKYEKEVLTDLMGYPLYTLFSAGIAEETPDQIWLDIRDGKEFSFEYDGVTVTRKWNGLINADKVSLIAYYCYYKIIFESLTDTTGIGEVLGNPENSVNKDNIAKAVNAWNKFIDLYGYTCGYDFSKFNDTYYTFTDRPSAYNFLNANRDIYPTWEFEVKRTINRFGI